MSCRVNNAGAMDRHKPADHKALLDADEPFTHSTFKFVMAYEFWTQIPWERIAATASVASNAGMSSGTSGGMLSQSKSRRCLHDKSRVGHNGLCSKTWNTILTTLQKKNKHFFLSAQKPFLQCIMAFHISLKKIYAISFVHNFCIHVIQCSEP